MRQRRTSKNKKHKKDYEASCFPLFLLQISNQSQTAAYLQSGLMKPQFPTGPLAARRKRTVSNNAGTFNSMLSLLKYELSFLWDFIKSASLWNTAQWIKDTMRPFLVCVQLFMDLWGAVGLQCLIRSVTKYKKSKNSPETKSGDGTLPSLQKHDDWPF